MIKYTIKHTSQFKKDYKLAKKRHLNVELLKDVVTKLADGEMLPEKYKDHSLSGKWSGHRECHLTPDWLLIYEIIDDIVVLLLYRVGSHSELFKK